MEDLESILRFENGTLRNENFHHYDHIKMAWLYLNRYPVLEALGKFSEALKRFATAHGKPDLYHQTITWSYIFIIHERRERSGNEQTWEEFATNNVDLFEWRGGILDSYYDSETLWSDFARKVFVFPKATLKLRKVEQRECHGPRSDKSP